MAWSKRVFNRGTAQQREAFERLCRQADPNESLARNLHGVYVQRTTSLAWRVYVRANNGEEARIRARLAEQAEAQQQLHVFNALAGMRKTLEAIERATTVFTSPIDILDTLSVDELERLKQHALEELAIKEH